MSHDGTTANMFIDIFHSLFQLIDSAVYALMVEIYNIFFSVATSTIIDGSIVRVFYQRIQLILGIFMVFKLAISLLNLIVNPELLKDKNSGPGKLVIRIIVCLLLITTIIPLNIPNAQPRTLNGYINDHGILFGMLYAVQDRVLSENIIAKLILGVSTTPSQSTSSPPSATVGNKLNDAGNMLATTVLKRFILINVEDDTLDDICGNDPVNCPNVYCVSEVQNSGYLDENASVGTILGVVNEQCNSNGKKYAFRYMIPLSTVVGVLLALILVGYTIDVSIRAIKLVVLRVLSPIPIISYIDPKASKDGAFASWTKTLISTYIDLFLRLAIIYFVIFLVASLSQNGLSLAIGNGATGLTKAFTYVFIVIGLLFFARQAPNFITTLLGAKGIGFGPGVSGALGFLGGFMGGGGLRGALAAGTTVANQTNEAQAQGKQGPSALSTGRDMAVKIRTGDDKAQGGILNRVQRTTTRMAKNRAADRIGAGEDNVHFRQDQMIRSQEASRDVETIWELSKGTGTINANTATRTYTDENGVTVNAGDYVDSRGNALTYQYRDPTTGRVSTVKARTEEDLARVRDYRRSQYENAQRSYEKVDKANKALGYQENEYERAMATFRHNRYVARRNRRRRAAGGTNMESRTRYRDRGYNSGGGEGLQG